jgi:hypothetical protein
MLGSCSTVTNSILEDSTRPTVVVSEQNVSRGQVCNGGLHEVKKSRDFGLNPLLNPSYLMSGGAAHQYPIMCKTKWSMYLRQ